MSVAHHASRPCARSCARPVNARWGSREVGLPRLGPGEYFLTDEHGAYLTDENGAYLIGKDA